MGIQAIEWNQFADLQAADDANIAGDLMEGFSEIEVTTPLAIAKTPTLILPGVSFNVTAGGAAVSLGENGGTLKLKSIATPNYGINIQSLSSPYTIAFFNIEVETINAGDVAFTFEGTTTVVDPTSLLQVIRVESGTLDFKNFTMRVNIGSIGGGVTIINAANIIGWINGVPYGLPLLVSPITSNIIYWDFIYGKDINNGFTPDQSKKTLSAAITAATLGKGYVFCINTGTYDFSIESITSEGFQNDSELIGVYAPGVIYTNSQYDSEFGTTVIVDNVGIEWVFAGITLTEFQQSNPYSRGIVNNAGYNFKVFCSGEITAPIPCQNSHAIDLNGILPEFYINTLNGSDIAGGADFGNVPSIVNIQNIGVTLLTGVNGLIGNIAGVQYGPIPVLQSEVATNTSDITDLQGLTPVLYNKYFTTVTTSALDGVVQTFTVMGAAITDKVQVQIVGDGTPLTLTTVAARISATNTVEITLGVALTLSIDIYINRAS